MWYYRSSFIGNVVISEIKKNAQYKISSKNKMLRHSAFIAVFNLTVTNGSSITKKIPTPGPK
jgi:hypothetical protein